MTDFAPPDPNTRVMKSVPEPSRKRLDSNSSARVIASTYSPIHGVHVVLRHSARCHVCCSDYRTWIEEQILRNRTTSAIIRDLPLMFGENVITVAMIRAHISAGHCNADTSTAFQSAQAVAERQGVVADQVVTQLVDALSLTTKIMGMTHDRLQAGAIEPDVGNGIAAAKLNNDILDRHQDQVDTQVFTAALSALFMLVREMMPAPRFAEFVNIMRTNPAVRRMVDASIEAQSREAISA